MLHGSCALFALSSCQLGLHSYTTGQALVGDSATTAYNNWRDEKLFRFAHKACRDTFQLPTLHGPFSKMKKPYAIGAVWVDNANVWMDEAEISNREWRHYEGQQLKNGVSATALSIETRAQPVGDYYTSGFYNYYPVVGISYE